VVRKGKCGSARAQQKKALPKQGFFRNTSGLLGADEFDIDTTVRLQALDDLLALRTRALTRLGHRLLLALAFGVDAVGFDSLADQIGLDRAARRSDSFWL
jgi:hypothetical protein